MIAKWLSRYTRYTAFSLVAGNRISRQNRDWFVKLAKQRITHEAVRQAVFDMAEQKRV